MDQKELDQLAKSSYEAVQSLWKNWKNAHENNRAHELKALHHACGLLYHSLGLMQTPATPDTQNIPPPQPAQVQEPVLNKEPITESVLKSGPKSASTQKPLVDQFRGKPLEDLQKGLDLQGRLFLAKNLFGGDSQELQDFLEGLNSSRNREAALKLLQNVQSKGKVPKERVDSAREMLSGLIYRRFTD